MWLMFSCDYLRSLGVSAPQMSNKNIYEPWFKFRDLCKNENGGIRHFIEPV